jgi:hypothetical protein
MRTLGWEGEGEREEGEGEREETETFPGLHSGNGSKNTKWWSPSLSLRVESSISFFLMTE